MDKKHLRQEVLQTLNTIPKEQHERKSMQLTHLLINCDEWKQSMNIAVTISNFPEVNTSYLINQAKQENKRFFVPKCNPKTKEMSFYEWNEHTEFERVYGNLLEPIIQTTSKIDKNKLDLIIVPGVVYSKDGYRIGFGGGYYDRYLVGFKGKTISLLFKEQLKDTIPVEIYDCPVQKMIVI